jgi:hypothetical protein
MNWTEEIKYDPEFTINQKNKYYYEIRLKEESNLKNKNIKLEFITTFSIVVIILFIFLFVTSQIPEKIIY